LYSSSTPTTADMDTWTEVCIPVPTAKDIDEAISKLPASKIHV